MLFQTPRGRKNFGSRNLSIGLPNGSANMRSNLLSPAPHSIIQSARQEAKNLSYEVGKVPMTTKNSIVNSGTSSPTRKRNSHALLYGKQQERSRVRLQIQQRLEEAAF